MKTNLSIMIFSALIAFFASYKIGYIRAKKDYIREKTRFWNCPTNTFDESFIFIIMLGFLFFIGVIFNVFV